MPVAPGRTSITFFFRRAGKPASRKSSTEFVSRIRFSSRSSLAQGFPEGGSGFLAELMDHKEKLCIEIATIDKEEYLDSMVGR